jgi:uncharacterized protein (TIGR02453 family)
MYRIYRDTRFSADKSPYKTHVAAHFFHEARKQAPSVPGFYLHLELGESLGGGGVYHPDPKSLAKVRLAIVENSKAWAAVKQAGIEVAGERLTRVPSGFDASHPFVEDLKHKDYFSLVTFTEKQVTSADFLDRYLDSCETVAPLVGFVAKANGLKF